MSNSVRFRNPVESDSPLSTNRKLYCAFQNVCLDKASRLRWGGMSCLKCGAYEEMVPLQMQSDVITLTALARYIQEMPKCTDLQISDAGHKGQLRLTCQEPDGTPNVP